MKRYTSRFLKSVALAFMGFPAVYLLFAALLFDIPAADCVRILLAPSFYVLSILAIATGWGLWEMRRWAWYGFLLTCVLTGYTNAVMASDFGETHHGVLAFIFSIAVLIGLIFRVGREVRVPYFLPRIRWWESNPRYRLSVPVRIERRTGAPIDAEILDLSMSGAFIKLRDEMGADEPVNLAFKLFGLPVSCAGSVVWRTQSAVTHPRGIGVKFAPLPRNQKRALRAMTRQLSKISSLYRSSRLLLSSEEFHKRLDELQREQLTLGADSKS
jgi:hypothetical protein